MQDIDRQLNAILEEYKYVQSMIPLYRGFQNQSIRFLFIIYAALIVLLGTSILGTTLLDNTGGQTKLMAILAFIPWIVEVIIVSWLMAEIRIIRASKFTQIRITEKIDALTNSADLLQWEKSPSRYIGNIESIFASSTFVVVVLAVPALLTGLLATIELSGLYFYVALLGTLALFLTTIGVSYVSARHEWRNPKDDGKKVVVSVSETTFSQLKSQAHQQNKTVDEYVSEVLIAQAVGKGQKRPATDNS